jgi:hypothetical protein
MLILKTSCSFSVLTIKALMRKKIDSFMISVIEFWAMKDEKTTSGVATNASSTTIMVETKAYS